MGSSDLDIEPALRRLQKAGDSLLNDRNDKRGGLRPDPMREALAWKTARQARPEQSKAGARLRYEHARDVNQVARATPDFIARTLERHLPGMPASLDRINAERIIVERIFGIKDKLKPNPCLLTQPIIVDAPFLWSAGETHTLTGTGFGPAAGSVVLELDNPSGTTIPLTIVNWSDEAATVTVPAALPNGIPLQTLGKARLTRADAQCSDAVTINFEPPSMLLVARLTASASGWSIFDTHSKDHTLTSPVLPPRAEPFFIGALGTDVVISLSSSELEVADSPPSFSIISGPSLTSSRQRTITVRVTDDHFWNYRLTVDFVILQPTDETINPGWTAV